VTSPSDRHATEVDDDRRHVESLLGLDAQSLDERGLAVASRSTQAHEVSALGELERAPPLILTVDQIVDRPLKHKQIAGSHLPTAFEPVSRDAAVGAQACLYQLLDKGPKRQAQRLTGGADRALCAASNTAVYLSATGRQPREPCRRSSPRGAAQSPQPSPASRFPTPPLHLPRDAPEPE
jgi:hypothetical protein